MERPRRVRVPRPGRAGLAQPRPVVIVIRRVVMMVVMLCDVVVILVVVMVRVRLVQIVVDVEGLAAGMVVHQQPDVGRGDRRGEACRDEGGEG
jgi:hypothetical protein